VKIIVFKGLHTNHSSYQALREGMGLRKARDLLMSDLETSKWTKMLRE
jgi:hypothetical protein